ncbi:hypothetical protein RSOLAG1IB_03665 [Rhizoctonia solani AG-1 IB]|uniref:Uncharacterized protein n=1 Tax=Thanatephorus cucumeris (strain AG1-IB / isolate 7/3/14) TaxID=1108050 RepID=M5BPF3_THACB|nr:hypothetical protein BN14_02239 [Rhizoctonia solani AG-1 IB]CEL59732.1 hypothetical protein RSOLAG1IB_03665 [Rhizoctonia solani AG-1 IB]
MKLVSLAAVVGLVSLVSGCTIPADWNRSAGTTIRSVAKSRNVTQRLMLALFEAAWVESHVNNLNCGDRDSLGVFQQRPSQGWCSPSSLCLDVTHATNAFIDKAVKVAKPSMTPGQLAQAVQVSAYPDRYDAAESKARSIISALGGF